jgi:RNA polymerase sigma-70 factor (ECF subfamily)
MHPSEERDQVLSAWIHEHYAMVARTVFLYVKDVMVAEDITQEVFLRAYSNMEDYRGDSKVSTWLCRIAINASKDYLRSWSYRKVIFTKALPLLNSTESAEDEVMRKLQGDEVLQRVMALPLKYREVVILRYLEDMEVREIAELLGLRESSIYTRLQRGIAKLQEHEKRGVYTWNQSKSN